MPKQVIYRTADGVLTVVDLIILGVSYVTFSLLELVAVIGPLLLSIFLKLTRQHLPIKPFQALQFSLPLLYGMFLVTVFCGEGVTFDSMLAGVGIIPMLMNCSDLIGG